MTRIELKKWRRITDAANARGEFTMTEHDAAEGWHTCAVGESRQLVPRVVLITKDFWGLGEPDDGQLRRLGASFATAVIRNHMLRAYELLDRIEARVTELEARADV